MMPEVVLWPPHTQTYVLAHTYLHTQEHIQTYIKKMSGLDVVTYAFSFSS